MFLKVVRILIVLVILFSYLPISHMNSCPDEGRRINCGYVFHCPFISNNSLLESIAVLNVGRLVLVTPLQLNEDFEYPIFHPPETSHKSPFVL